VPDRPDDRRIDGGGQTYAVRALGDAFFEFLPACKLSSLKRFRKALRISCQKVLP
jgi:hypothetical protein